MFFFFFKQKTAYEMLISDWSSDVCSSDLGGEAREAGADQHQPPVSRGGRAVARFDAKVADTAGGGGDGDGVAVAVRQCRRCVGGQGGGGRFERGDAREGIVVVLRRGRRTADRGGGFAHIDRKSTRLNSSP